MKVNLLGPLVETENVFEAMVYYKDQSKIVSPEVRDFLRFKLEQTAKSLRETAKHIERELKAMDDA